jgi:hypothetical protein
MLLFGQQRQRNCQSLSRRSFLQIGASTALGLSLADRLKSRALAGSGLGGAKSVVLLWLWGGPAQLDTFDPKPNAPIEYRGPFGTIPTRISGVRFCELFPKLASLTDKLAVIRSLHTQSVDHGIAGTIGLTGSIAGGVGLDLKPLPGLPQPATGSVVARAKGFRGKLPPFMVVGGKLHQGKKTIIGEGGGRLGGLYDPFRLEYDPVNGTKVPALQLGENLTPERLTDRQTLRTALESVQRKSEHLTKSGLIEDYRAQAFAMLTSATARKVFELAEEPAKVLDGYGRTRFGQSCVMARRLVEAGVPFVQVNWSDHVEAEEDSGDGGWDHHYRNFQIMQDRHAVWLDQAMSSLVKDLDERGLLATTLVLAFGEFGRSPKINDKAGRDHWAKCFSALAVGGGVAGGRVIGESNAKAEEPHENPLTPADICRTVHHIAGISSEQSAALGLDPGGRIIEELF